MQLEVLLKSGEIADAPAGCEAIAITGLTADSRQVKPGYLFAALPGVKADGARFIADAEAKGAVAILVGENTSVTSVLPTIRAREPRRTLALMAARFLGRQPATAVAVTGTSGKTSVADFTRQIFEQVGRKAASVGTIGIIRPGGATYGSLTTPDPVTLHETLAALADEGVTHLAFEASSHGLDQHRLDGVKLSAAAFTNLGRDHLDYHPTIEAYLKAKLRLFEQLLAPGQTAVINTDGEQWGEVAAAALTRQLKVMTVGSKGAHLKLASRTEDGFAQRLQLVYEGEPYDLRLPLLGAYQTENALVAAGLAIAVGEAPNAVLAALEHLRGVKGRLEIVGEKNGGLAAVDYAHKPEALAAVLAAVRPFVTGKLICVFGCGGDRDRGKRPIMGDIAVKRADIVIVTDDNPRSEAPGSIRAEILSAAHGAREIGDRAAAIAEGVRLLGPGDVLVVAGKGHETGQIMGDRVIPFSDQDCLKAALAADATTQA